MRWRRVMNRTFSASALRDEINQSRQSRLDMFNIITIKHWGSYKRPLAQASCFPFSMLPCGAHTASLHSFTVLSSDALASRAPSGLNSQHVTLSLWPRAIPPSSLPAAESHTCSAWGGDSSEARALRSISAGCRGYQGMVMER